MNYPTGYEQFTFTNSPATAAILEAQYHMQLFPGHYCTAVSDVAMAYLRHDQPEDSRETFNYYCEDCDDAGTIFCHPTFQLINAVVADPIPPIGEPTWEDFTGQPTRYPRANIWTPELVEELLDPNLQKQREIPND